MKPHRYVQLFGLYGVLFLIPTLQQQVNIYSSTKEIYQREQTFSVIKHMYYDLKTLTCKQLGQEYTTHDCEKGIYQDSSLNLAIKNQHELSEAKEKTLSVYWKIYYVFALLGFIGTYIEYNKEYEIENVKVRENKKHRSSGDSL